MVLASFLLILGCGPRRDGCKWFDRECPDSPVGRAETSSTSTDNEADLTCVEDCDGDLECEADCANETTTSM